MLILPLYLIIFDIFIIFYIVRQSIINKIFYKNRLIFSMLALFTLCVIAIFYSKIENKKIIDIVCLAVEVILCLGFLFTITPQTSLVYFQKQIITQFDKLSYYIFIDKKLKIADMSNLLIEKFGYLDKSEVLSKKVKEIFSSNVSFKGINDKDFTLNEFINYINSFKTKKDAKSRKLTLRFFDKDHNLFELEAIETPLFISQKYIGLAYISETINHDKVLDESNYLDEYKLLKERVEGLLDVSDSTYAFIDLEKDSLWANDLLVKKLKLQGNIISLKEYHRLIEKNDYEVYLQSINSTSINEPHYDTTYRILIDDNYYFVKEKGYVIYQNKKRKEIVCTLSIASTRNFEKTSSDIFDNIKNEINLNIDINTLIESKKVFMLVYTRIDNIEQINKKHSRYIGSLIMAEYIETIKNKFIDDDLYYRISGLNFVFIITDYEKMKQFSTLVNRQKILKPTISYGSLDILLDVYMGISFSTDSIRPTDTLANAKRCLDKILEDNSSNFNYLFYKELK